MPPASTFSAVLVALLVAHNFADHWCQTHHQALTKGQRTRSGQRACLAHVATYTATTSGVVGLLWWLFDLPINPLGFVLGQLVSAVTHYWADRRYTLAWLAERIGKGEFYRLGTPRGHTVRIENTIVRHDAPGGRVLSPAPETVPLDNPTLGTGAYALDQSWHWLWLGVAAVITAVA